MTREECEKAILDKAQEIADIYSAYNGEDDYLSIAICNDTICINNSYFMDNYNLPVIHCFSERRHKYVGM